MFTTSADRVAISSPEQANEAIREEIDQNVARLAGTDPRQIGERLEELDREWDIERTLEANAATIVLVGTALGAFVDKKFFVLPAVVGGFLLQHALQGWCPPLPIFRSLGIRTQQEIEQERYALKALRGDFRGAGESAAGDGRAAKALDAARR